MGQKILRTDEQGRKVVSVKDLCTHIDIGTYVAEDGTLCVSVGDLVIGQLPDLAAAFSDIDREHRACETIILETGTRNDPESRDCQPECDKGSCRREVRIPLVEGGSLSLRELVAAVKLSFQGPFRR